MFCVFLPALNFRGNRSPYLWWFYKFLDEFGPDAAYICGKEYFLEAKTHLDNGRTEASVEAAQHYQYQIPDAALLNKLPRIDIGEPIWAALEDQFPANPLAAFRHFCLDDDPLLHQALVDALDQVKLLCGDVEVIITCINCASLQHLCNDRNVRLLHLELGPLRAPEYLQTSYFDFSGVNGGTESRRRFQATTARVNGADDSGQVTALRSLFMMGNGLRQVQPVADLGIGLQVEDDSNVICYSNGFSSSALLNGARRLLAEKRIFGPVLVRGHPGSMFTPKNLPSGFDVDQSETAVDFIQRCRHIHTINSSLAVESLLQGRKATVFGDGPFAYCIDPSTQQGDASALSFFLLNYLVPGKLAMSSNYIRWRLGNPTEDEIRDAHLEFYMREKIALLEARIADLEQALVDRDNQIARLRSSFFWRIFYLLRASFKSITRLVSPAKE